MRHGWPLVVGLLVCSGSCASAVPVPAETGAAETRAPASSVPDCILEDGLLGTWTLRPEAGVSLHLTRESFAVAHGHDLQGIYPVVACDQASFSVCSFGQRQTISPVRGASGVRFEVEGTGIAKAGDYVSGGTADFTAAPMEIPEPMALEQSRVGSIVKELERRVQEDQRVRRQQPPDFEEMQRVDAENEAWLTSLVSEIGWIDIDRFGEVPSMQAWLIAQHASSLPLMIAVADALDKKRQGSKYALMTDRISMRQGKPQRYGSQVVSDGRGGMGLFPLERPDDVDALRSEVGLQPLAEYLKQFGMTEPVEIRCE